MSHYDEQREAWEDKQDWKQDKQGQMPAWSIPKLASKPPTAPDLLTKAASIMAERGKQYDADGGERSMGKAVKAFNAITGHKVTEPEGWLLLQVLKDVRLFTKAGYHQDSAEDCIAYAALKAEAKQAEA